MDLLRDLLRLLLPLGAYLWRANPHIFVARSKLHRRGTKPWDRVLIVLLLGAFFAVFATAAVDARRGWSSVPAWLVLVGYLLFALVFVGSTWVYAVNRFAEPLVRIQADRGQRVIDSGPYAIVRHPLYAASLPLFAGMPLAMGSFWALLPVAVAAAVLVVRIVLEERVLRAELAGYQNYVSRVRYRPVPGIW